MTRRSRPWSSSWVAPILLWYEQTMQGLAPNSDRAVEHATHTRSWFRRLEQKGEPLLRPLVLTVHARQRYIERYGGDPNHLDLEAFKFTGVRSLSGSPIVTDGTVYLVVSRERKCYRAMTALTPTKLSADKENT